jgi:hypothetical protein
MGRRKSFGIAGVKVAPRAAQELKRRHVKLGQIHVHIDPLAL